MKTVIEESGLNSHLPENYDGNESRRAQIKFGQKQNRDILHRKLLGHPKFSTQVSKKLKSLKYKASISQESVKYTWPNWYTWTLLVISLPFANTSTYTVTVTSAEKGWRCSHACCHPESEACSGLTSGDKSHSRVPSPLQKRHTQIPSWDLNLASCSHPTETQHFKQTAPGHSQAIVEPDQCGLAHYRWRPQN